MAGLKLRRDIIMKKPGYCLVNMVISTWSIQLNLKFCSGSLGRNDMQLAPVCLYDIMCNAQPKACAIRSFFGGEEGLKDLVLDGFGYTRTIVGDGKYDLIAIAL
jgi:hypothetical protein